MIKTLILHLLKIVNGKNLLVHVTYKAVFTNTCYIQRYIYRYIFNLNKTDICFYLRLNCLYNGIPVHTCRTHIYYILCTNKFVHKKESHEYV